MASTKQPWRVGGGESNVGGALPRSPVSEARVRRSGMLGHALCLNIKGLSWLSGHRLSTLAARLGWGWGGVSVRITSAWAFPLI